MRKKWLVVYAKNMFNRCWLLNHKYESISGYTIHKHCEYGEGELVRHMCGNAYCINPLHHMRGSTGENAMDKRDKNYYIKLLKNNLNRRAGNQDYASYDEIQYMYHRNVMHPGMDNKWALFYADYIVEHYECDDAEQKWYAEILFKELNRLVSKKTIQLTVMEDYYNELK